MTIWFTTDPHLFHANILTFKDETGALIRPGFKDIQEMNERILENHNSVVKTTDKVYWGGDVMFKVTPEHLQFFKKFNGKHRLCVGNHDPIKEIAPHFQKVLLWRCFNNEGDIPFCFAHIPIDVLSIRGYFHVHGHIHQNNEPTDWHINICPEKTNYMPTSYDELQLIMRNRIKKLDLCMPCNMGKDDGQTYS